MSPHLVPYVLIERSPRKSHLESSRKRKASLSPSPSSSFRAPSPNPSPTKKLRGDQDVDVAAKRFFRFDWDEDADREESPTISLLELARRRPASPTVSELAGPSIRSVHDVQDEFMSVDEPDSSTTAADEIEKYADFVEEHRLPKLLHETPGDGLPIRRLRDFTIFNRDDMRLISAVELLQDDLPLGTYGASGLVTSVDENDQSGSEDGDDCGRVKLLPLVGFDVHDFNEDCDDEVNEYIYIKTNRAWYILETASRKYQPLWRPFKMQHNLTHRALTRALNDPPVTYPQFFRSLNLQEQTAVESDDVVAYMSRAIYRAIEANAPLARVPLIQHVIKEEEAVSEQSSSESSAFGDYSEDPLSEEGEEGEEGEDASSKSFTHSDQRKSKPGQHAQNYFTDVVARVVRKHLSSPVYVVGAEFKAANETMAKELQEMLEHHDDPANVRWVDHLRKPGYYSSVKMDGVLYKIGDVVAVASGGDDNTHRADSEDSAVEHCVNNFANNVWFCQIMYFFDNPEEKERGKPRKMFHGHWFSHGSRTLLQEVTHTQELFLLHECDDIAVASIFQKCDVRFLDISENEEADKFDPEARDYFCQLTYDAETHEFTDLPTQEERERLEQHLDKDPQDHCLSCKRESDLTLYRLVQRVDDGLAQYGRVYHADDFVYIKPDLDAKTGLCLFIAQVLSVDFEGLLLEVRYYERHPDDSRQIYRTRRKNSVKVDDLDGHCFVRHLDPEDPEEEKEIESWVEAHPDHFYLCSKASKGNLEAIDKEDFDHCEACFDAHCGRLQEAVELTKNFGKIPVLEVFSGAGGLSQGLDQSGFFETKWAVEKSVPAAETFRLNHPETNVLCADINDLLRYSVDLRDGKTPEVFRSADKAGTPISRESVPTPGYGPGVVCGGPPCQSFSGANGHKKEDDSRSTLPFTMLSVAEVYEANFFLLENVTGLLQHSVRNGKGREGRVEKATLKLIIRALTALGFQVRFKVLQAGQYGAPQHRERVIFFGAKRGCKLPEFPVPTHAFLRPAYRHKLFIKDDFIPPARRGRGPDDDHIFAPHASVSIEDAIGDLPGFDWVNPHNVMDKTPEDATELNQRVAKGIRQFPSDKAPVGFCDPVAYLTPPQTRYQRAMRRGNPKKVEHHITDSATPFVAEVSATVPLKPLANHKDLPKEFFNSKLKEMSSLSRDSPIACFGRLDAQSYFKTAMTQAQPRSRGSYLLHPSQKRAISVVEAKRAQGFPDDYVLWSDKSKAGSRVKDYYRHIGNAVPVPLAAALARSLQEAIVETAKRLPREESSTREDSPTV
ncbi:S-adenosyl-L-methionine-dependent methyltransferase [Mycena metata]|uniref:DNA (cytosine-5-)-methyltransferase n=1 Tax=Mycena metata TaxID=1033252 RepID=A0AAD7JNC9_9AGAR|nr:S-adenosyl-L-methionine-dependent methyltransferase [Mycena metata]